MVKTALPLLKAALGITTNFRDKFLTKLIEGVVTELTDEKGIAIDKKNANHIMFVVDYADWRYKGRDTVSAMPLHLKARLKDLYVNRGGGSGG